MIIQLLSKTPAFKKWEESLADHEKDDYSFFIDVHLRVDKMLCYIDVLWPKFVEISGMILNKGHLPDDWRGYLDGLKNAEWSYKEMIRLGASPQIARSVLPISLKAQIVITCNLREWRHIITLRTNKAAHPTMRNVMMQIANDLIPRCPNVFYDIKEKPNG